MDGSGSSGRLWGGRRCGDDGRRGAVLLVVFVLVTLLSFAAIAGFMWMRTENMAGKLQNSRAESQLLMDSGVEYLRLLIENPRSERESIGGLLNNPALFRGLLVSEDLMIENDLFGLSGTSSATELGVDLTSSSAYSGTGSTGGGSGGGLSGGGSLSGNGSDSLSGGSDAGFASADAVTEPISGPLQGDSAGSSGSSLSLGSSGSGGGSWSGGRVRTAHRGRIAVVSPLDPSNVEDCGVKFGMENESGKLHLSLILEWEKASPGAGRAALMRLPGMTETAADSVLDWMDEDDELRAFGAESEYYIQQMVPYLPRNGLPQNLEELLLVQGVTRELLFGADIDGDFLVRDEELERVGMLSEMHNDGTGTGGSTPGATSGGTSSDLVISGGLLADSSENDPNAAWENGGDATGSSLMGSGIGAGTLLGNGSSLSESSTLTVPWCRYLTVCSAERNVSRTGEARVWLNNPDLATLQSQLGGIVSSQTAEYIMFYRINGAYTGNEVSGEMPAQRPTPNTGATPAVTFRTVLDIVGTRCQIGTVDQQTTNADGTTTTTTLPLILDCPMTTPSDADVAALLDGAAVDETAVLYGRINIYDAQPEVLMAIPGMTESTMSLIVAAVQGSDTGSSAATGAGSTGRLMSGVDSAGDDFAAGGGEIRSEGLVPLAQGIDLVTLRQLLPYITAGGDVFRGQMVAFWDDGTPGMRMEFVLDGTSTPARLVYHRDLTLFGIGFRPEDLGGEPVLDGTQYTQGTEYENPFETNSTDTGTGLGF